MRFTTFHSRTFIVVFLASKMSRTAHNALHCSKKRFCNVYHCISVHTCRVTFCDRTLCCNKSFRTVICHVSFNTVCLHQCVNMCIFNAQKERVPPWNLFIHVYLLFRSSGKKYAAENSRSTLWTSL